MNTYEHLTLMESIRNFAISKHLYTPENNKNGLRNVCITVDKDENPELCVNCYVYESPCDNCIICPEVVNYTTVSYSDVFNGVNEDGTRKWVTFPLTYEEFYYTNKYAKEYKWNSKAGRHLTYSSF